MYIGRSLPSKSKEKKKRRGNIQEKKKKKEGEEEQCMDKAHVQVHEGIFVH